MMHGGYVKDAGTMFSKWYELVLKSTMPCASNAYYKGIYPDTSKDLSAECAFHLKKMMYVSSPEM